MSFSWKGFPFFVAFLYSGILSLQMQDSNVCQCLINNSECFVVATCKNSSYIKSRLEFLNISIISDETTHCGQINRTSEYSKYRKLHRMVYHNILESIVDVMIFWQRYQGVLIADSFSGIDDSTQKYLKTRGIDMKIVSGEDMKVTGSVLKQPDYENFIVICSPRNTQKILIAANESALFDGVQSWIVVAHQLPLILQSIRIAPQTFVTLFMPSLKSEVLLKDVLTSENETVKDNDISKQQLQPKLVHCDEAAAQNGVSIVLSSESITALEYSSASRVNMFDVFYGHRHKKTEAVQFGIWHENNGTFMFEVLNPEDKEQRVRGKMIRASTFEHNPYTILTKIDGELHVGGYSKELIDMLLDTLDIRYTMKEAPQVYGIGINGTFTGLIGILNRKEADITINVMAMTNSRREGVRYAGPVTRGHLGICYNRLEAIMPPTAYLLPFQLPVWILILISAIVIGVLIMVSMSLSPGSLWTSTPSKELHSTTYRLLTGTVFEEALEDPPGLPSKIIYGTLILTTMLVFIYYTSVFTSFLTSLDVPVPFKNLEDVIKNNEYAIVYLENTRHHDAFRYAQDGLFHAVWQRLTSDKNTIGVRGGNFEVGLKIMYTGKYAYLTEGPTTYYLAAHNCSVAFASKKYLPEFFYSISRLDFPYSRLMAMSLMRTMEGGILQRLGEVYKVNRKPVCKVENTSSSLGLNQVAAVFLVWFCGVALALLAFFCERTVFKKYAEKQVEIEPKLNYF